MSVDQQLFRTAMSRFATGVTVVTTVADGAAEVMTANAVASISLEPTLLLVSVRDPSPWLRAVGKHRRFAVNILGSQHEGLARWCSQHQRRARPRQVHEYGAVLSPTSGLVVVPGALAVVECRLYAEHPAGDHALVLGEVDAVEMSDRPTAPLLFFEREFRGPCAPAKPSVIVSPTSGDNLLPTGQS